MVNVDASASFGRFGEGPIAHLDNDTVTLNQVHLCDFRPAALTRGQVEELQAAMRLGGGPSLRPN